MRELHPTQPDMFIMLDWPFYWFQITDVKPAPHIPPKPRLQADSKGAPE